MLLIQQLNKSNIYLMGYFYCPVFIIFYISTLFAWGLLIFFTVQIKSVFSIFTFSASPTSNYILFSRNVGNTLKAKNGGQIPQGAMSWNRKLRLTVDFERGASAAGLQNTRPPQKPRPCITIHLSQWRISAVS